MSCIGDDVETNRCFFYEKHGCMNLVHVKFVPQISCPGLGDQALVTASGARRAGGCSLSEREHERGRRKNWIRPSGPG